MKLLFLSLLSGCFIINSGLCQINENTGVRILFQGVVMDAGTFSPIVNSQITINRKYFSVSGEAGIFSFYVNRTDTVVFKSLGYKSTTLFISDTLSGKEFIAGIYMRSDTLEIGEVIIVPRYSNLKSEIMNAPSRAPSTMDNARYNVAVSAYAAKNSISSLGDPESNYEMLRQRQKTDAFERGGIPSDKILGLSPLMLIPAAYLLVHGLPEKPEAFKPEITSKELDDLNKRYLELIRKKSEYKK
jgi:hypothetical protein